MSQIVTFNQVSFSYPGGIQALKEVSFAIAKGEFVALVGRNGSGKTTILQNIMNLQEPEKGEILIGKESNRGKGPAWVAQTVGYVFQHPERQMFLPTVLEEVAYGPRQQGFSKDAAEKKAREALERVKISHLIEEYPKALSRGEIQRVAIAIVLALEPELIILDEPTSGQDGAATQGLRKLLEELHQGGASILLVTHDMELLAESAPRSIVMACGEKLFDGKTQELFQHSDCQKWGLELPVWLDIARHISDLPEIPADHPEKLIQELIIRKKEGKANEIGTAH